MSGETSGAAESRAEIDATPTEVLREVALSGRWTVHPLRVELDTAERLAAARRAVEDLDRNHGGDLWREQRSVSREAIAARRLAALARAWERLGGEREFLFHVRGEWRLGEDRQVLRRHIDAPEIAIDENPGVPEAPYLEHPISLAEAARLAIVLPVLRRGAQLGEAAARAFDVLGQPTTALDLLSRARRGRPARRIVWRVRSAARSRWSQVRMVLLTVGHVLEGLGAEARPERFGVPAVAGHPQGWGPVELVAIGELAWRRACELDLRVREPRARFGNRVLVDPAAVGRRYSELDDPFASLLAITRLGCRLHAFSREAATFELHSL